MSLKEILAGRRSYRSLSPVDVPDSLIEDLAECCQSAPSCFNNQPWRYVFVRDREKLEQLHAALTPGNDWARAASLIIAVVSQKDLDCIMKDGREYWAYDAGTATGFLILRAAELGLVAHPIAGYVPGTVKDVLGVPEKMQVVVLLICGKHADALSPVLSPKQAEAEKQRPARLGLDRICSIDGFFMK